MSKVASSPVHAGLPATLTHPADTVASSISLLLEHAEKAPLQVSETLVKMWNEKATQFSASDCVHALEICKVSARVRLDHYVETSLVLIPSLLDKVRTGIATLTGPELVRTSIALEGLRVQDPALQKQIATAAQEKISEFKGEGREKGLASIAWGLARHRCPHPEFFSAAEQVFEEGLSGIKPKWIDTVTTAARSLRLSTTKLQDLSEDARALRATERFNSDRDHDESEIHHAQPVYHYDFKRMSIEEIGAALRERDVFSDEQRLALHRVAYHRADQFSMKHLAALLETFRDTPRISTQTLDKLCNALTEKLAPVHGATPVILSALQSVWYTDRRQEYLLNTIAEKLTTKDPNDGSLRLTRLTPDDLALVAKVYADQNVYNKELVDGLADEFVSRGKDATPSAQKDWVYGLARMNRVDEGALTIVHHIISTDRASVGVRAASVFAGAAALSDSPIAPLIWKECVDRLESKGADIPEAVVFQLLQTGVALNQPIPGWLQDTLAVYDTPENQAHRAAFVASRQSNFEHDVKNQLLSLGLTPATQVPLHGYFIDMVVETGGTRYAIECDGSLYHQRGGRHSSVLLGNSEIKNRVLEREGYQVIRIADEEWSNLPDKGRMLRKVLGMPAKSMEVA